MKMGTLIKHKASEILKKILLEGQSSQTEERIVTQNCLYCKKELKLFKRQGRKRKRFCNTICYGKHLYETKRTPKLKTNNIQVCRHCKKEYIARSPLYCSKKCKNANRAERLRLTGRTDDKDKCKCGNIKTKRAKTCKNCSVSNVIKHKFRCNECDNLFTGVAHQKFCETKCANRFHSRERQNRMKTLDWVEDISKGIVLKRDKYKCQICFAPILNDVDFHHPMYPNIDHIIPLSKGGEHSYRNVQLTHAYCNQHDKKAD